MVTTSIPVSDTIKSVQVKSYGDLVIIGSENSEILTNSSNQETTTISVSNHIVYVTAMSSCELFIPQGLNVIIEKGLGSVKITGIKSDLTIEKVLGNLIVDEAGQISIEKVGGTCALRNVKGALKIEKIGGDLALKDFSGMQLEKMGGSCDLKDGSGDVFIKKVGGDFSASGLHGHALLEKVGGELTCDQAFFGLNCSVGGDVILLLRGTLEDTNIRAGGDIKLYLPQDLRKVDLSLQAGGEIALDALGYKQSVEDGIFSHKLDDSEFSLVLNAGGDINLLDTAWQESAPVGDLSARFTEEKMGTNELIHEHVRRVTEMAQKRIEEAQKNLENIKVEIKGSEFKIPKVKIPSIPSIPPVPSIPADASTKVSEIKIQKKKGATDEERLLILQMLQEKKISVNEAEKLFRALEK